MIPLEPMRPAFRYGLPAFVLGGFLACAIIGAGRTGSGAAQVVHTEVSAHGHAVIHILRANDEGEAVGEAVTSPLFAFRVEDGHVRDEETLECEQVTETRTEKDVSYPVVTLQQCHERDSRDDMRSKLSVVGLDLTVKR